MWERNNDMTAMVDIFVEVPKPKRERETQHDAIGCFLQN
jgi:hypothetical protein